MTISTLKRPRDSLVYPFPTPPAPAEFVQVAPGVYWLRMPLPFLLDHINLWLLEDSGGWTIVDTGLGTSATRQLWEALYSTVMAEKPVRRIIVTHFHPDHVGLASWLTERFGCELWMTEPEYQMTRRAVYDDAFDDSAARLEFFRRHGLSGKRLKGLAAWGGSYRQGVPGLPASFVPVEHQQHLQIGGYEWRVITACGHSPDHATLYCEAAGVLISGDQILPSITPHVGVWPSEPDADPIRCYLESLRRFAGFPAPTLVLPAHGLPFIGLEERLEVLARHHEQRFDVLMQACEQPRSATQLLDALFRRRLNAHQLLFAMGEAVAHLNYLYLDGNLVRSLDSNGNYQFQRS